MGLDITNPAIGPTTSSWDQPSRSAPTTVISSLRLVKKEDETTRITITQTLPRPSSTWIATATLHGGFPATPPARSSGGVSNGQIGAIIGATSATIIGILVIGWYCLRRRRRGQSVSKSSRSTISPFSSPPSSPRPFPPRPPSSYLGQAKGSHKGSQTAPPGPDFNNPPNIPQPFIPPAFNGRSRGSVPAQNSSGEPIPPTNVPNFQNSSSNPTFGPQLNVPRPYQQSSRPFGEQIAPQQNPPTEVDSKPNDDNDRKKGQNTGANAPPEVINVGPGPSTRDRQGSKSHRTTGGPKTSGNNKERSKSGKQGVGPVSANNREGYYESRPKESNRQQQARNLHISSTKSKGKPSKASHDQEPPNAPIIRARRDTNQPLNVTLLKYFGGASYIK